MFSNCTKSKIRANLSLELTCRVPGVEVFYDYDAKLDLRECLNMSEAKAGWTQNLFGSEKFADSFIILDVEKRHLTSP